MRPGACERAQHLRAAAFRARPRYATAIGSYYGDMDVSGRCIQDLRDALAGRSSHSHGAANHVPDHRTQP